MTRVLPLMIALAALALFSTTAIAAEEGESHEGKVVSAGGGKLTMTDKDGKNEHTHEVAADAKISLDGKESKLEDLQKGTSVKVSTAKKGDKTVVVKIEGKKAAKG